MSLMELVILMMIRVMGKLFGGDHNDDLGDGEAVWWCSYVLSTGVVHCVVVCLLC